MWRQWVALIGARVAPVGLFVSVGQWIIQEMPHSAKPYVCMLRWEDPYQSLVFSAKWQENVAGGQGGYKTRQAKHWDCV